MPSKWISKKVRQSIYTRDNMVCCYCGTHCQPYAGTMLTDTVTLDHIVSQKELAAASSDDADFKAKQHNPKNIVVVCNSCNSSKQETPLYVWCQQTGKDYAAIIIRIGKRIGA